MTVSLNINGKDVAIDTDADTPLLWAIRHLVNLTGTKFGCGMALCGACTVYIDGVPSRSCITPVSAVAGRKITTIEGLSGPTADAVRKAWLDVDVVQCGYCQSGQILAATALLNKTPKPTDADIDAAMSGNLCRCGTYPRIREAIRAASTSLKS